jgi:hypothetical protein
VDLGGLHPIFAITSCMSRSNIQCHHFQCHHFPSHLSWRNDPFFFLAELCLARSFFLLNFFS